MIEINLLPKEMRKAHGLGIPKSVLVGAGAAAAVIVLLALVTVYQMYRVHGIDSRIAEVRRQADRMREDIIIVDRLVDVKTKILARLAAIDKLDRGRERWVKILDELSHRVPDFLWLTTFKPAVAASGVNPRGIRTPGAGTPADSAATDRKDLAIAGYSFTLNGLANFLIELNASEYFGGIQLDFAKVVEVGRQHLYNFSLRCRLEDPVGLEEMRDVENAASSRLTDHSTAPGVAAHLED